MTRNVTIHVTRNNDGSYLVTGSVVGKGGGTLHARNFENEDALRNFLAGDARIDAEEIKKAIQGCSRVRSYSIRDVWLTDEEIEKYGLGPI